MRALMHECDHEQLVWKQAERVGLFSQEKREGDLTQPPVPKGAVRELQQDFSQGPVVIEQGEWL